MFKKTFLVFILSLCFVFFITAQNKAFIESSEKNIDKNLSVKIFENKLKESLLENDFKLVSVKNTANYIFKSVLNTKSVSEYQGIFTSRANAQLNVFDKAGQSIFTKAFTNVKGGGLNYEHAGSKALEKVAKKLITELEVFLLTTDLEPVANNNTIKIETSIQTQSDKTAPGIRITSPSVLTRGLKAITQEKELQVKGYATDESGVFSVYINQQEANLSADGYFTAAIKLKVGENLLKVTAEDIHGNKVHKEYVLTRGSQETTESAEFDLTTLDYGVGTYYALIIGVNNYPDASIQSLSNPISDAESLFDVLTQKYSFERNKITFIKNATRRDIIIAFDDLSKTITDKDNLLIFYAGHGHWDTKIKQGYWLPSDASKNNSVEWLRNSTIQGYIESIKSRHTLLIADACFSGGIFRTRKAFSDATESINKLYELPSRKAMTSGTLKEVPDESVFLEYLVKRLNANTEKYLSAQDLFTSFRTAVLNNSPNTPQYGTIRDSGDEGGDFIFIRRE